MESHRGITIVKVRFILAGGRLGKRLTVRFSITFYPGALLSDRDNSLRFAGLGLSDGPVPPVTCAL